MAARIEKLIESPRLSYLNFEEFQQDMDSGEIFQKITSPIFLVYLLQESQWCLVNKQYENLGYKFLGWNPDDNELLTKVASLSNISSLLSSLSQFNINNKILKYLQLNERKQTFYSVGGHCNAYSFLYNYYTDKGMEDYFFLSLVLIENWDGTTAGLSKEISPQLPQRHYYKTTGELIEQWTNDLMIFQVSKPIRFDVLPQLQQSFRKTQYSFFKPINLSRKETVDILFSNQTKKPPLSNAIVLTLNIEVSFWLTAIAKSKFSPIYRLSAGQTPLLKLKDIHGDEIEINPSELQANNQAVLQVKDTQGNECLLDKRGLNLAISSLQYRRGVQIQRTERKLVTPTRMLEQLKYLTRLPVGVYVDVEKGLHSTTFHNNSKGEIVFYNSNNSSPAITVYDYKQLAQHILDQGANFVDSKNLPSPSIISSTDINNIQQQDEFLHTVYHFNSITAKQLLRSFSLFRKDELPDSLEQAIAFQQSSPNRYTHLHLAVMYHDNKTIEYLIQNRLADYDSKDVDGITALDLAIKSGNIKAAKIILDSVEKSQHINSDFIDHAIAVGQHEGMIQLLNHPNAIVNLNSFTQAAMKFQCIDIVIYLLEAKKINPNDFIQQALLANDINLVELLIQYGADINLEDEHGNTALHYSVYMSNDTCFFYLINHPDIEPNQKNRTQLSPKEIAQKKIEQGKLTDEMKTSLTRIVGFYDQIPASSSKL